MHHSICIYNVTRRELADPIVAALEGKTFMKFHVGICPIGGSFDVIVECQCDYPHEEVVDMIMYVMAGEICRAAALPSTPV